MQKKRWVYDMLCMMRSKSKNSITSLNKLNIVVWSYCSNRLLCGIHCFAISISDSVSQFNDSTNKQREGVTKSEVFH